MGGLGANRLLAWQALKTGTDCFKQVCFEGRLFGGHRERVEMKSFLANTNSACEDVSRKDRRIRFKRSGIRMIGLKAVKQISLEALAMERRYSKYQK
jgi:hypothetical protein